MRIETPECVENRVYHEEALQPGTICRRYKRTDEDEWVPGPWFVVVTQPQQSSHGSEFVRVVWLEGDDEGHRERFFLRDLGVKPPHRGITEKHRFEIPEKYIASSYPERVAAGFAGRVFG